MIFAASRISGMIGRLLICIGLVDKKKLNLIRLVMTIDPNKEYPLFEGI